MSASATPSPHTTPGSAAAGALASRDRFGAFGGRYVPETLIPALDELEAAFDVAMLDPSFVQEWRDLLTHYVGRPSALSDAPVCWNPSGRFTLHFGVFFDDAVRFVQSKLARFQVPDPSAMPGR